MFINIFICNTCQYLYICRNIAKTDKENRKPKQHLEFTNSTDKRLCKHMF